MVVDYEPEHFFELAADMPEVARLVELDPEHARKLALQAVARSFRYGDLIVGIVGMDRKWQGCGSLWAVFRPEAGAHMLGITRDCMKLMEEFSERRMEAHVLDGFMAGHKWMRILGFKPEGLMRKWSPFGEDCWLYARVK